MTEIDSLIGVRLERNFCNLTNTDPPRGLFRRLVLAYVQTLYYIFERLCENYCIEQENNIKL